MDTQKKLITTVTANIILCTLFLLVNYMAPTAWSWEFLSVFWWEYIDFILACLELENRFGRRWWLYAVIYTIN